MGRCPSGDKLDQDIFDAMTEFVMWLMQRGERLAERFDVPVSCMKAMRRVRTQMVATAITAAAITTAVATRSPANS